MSYPAEVFHSAFLPKEIQNHLIEYFQGTDRAIYNDSYHPFPCSGSSVREASEELSPTSSDGYKALLSYFSEKYDGYLIIHFDW